MSAQALAADNKTLTESLVQLKAQMQQQSEMRAAAERQLSVERATVLSIKTQHLHMQSALTVSAVSAPTYMQGQGKDKPIYMFTAYLGKFK